MLCLDHFSRYYTPKSIKERLDGSRHPATVLRAAVEDLKRLELTEDELVELEWCFRFKESAGPAWTSEDPWWGGDAPARLRFSREGAIQRESGRFPDVQIAWRWGNSSSQSPASGEPPCRTVRATVNGRDVPSYVASRHPGHGGFLLQSCWALYTAFPMPARGEDPHLSDEALDLTVEAQQDEAVRYNSGGGGLLLQFGGRVVQVPAAMQGLLAEMSAEQLQQVIAALFSVQDEEGDDEGGDSGGQESSEGSGVDDAAGGPLP